MSAARAPSIPSTPSVPTYRAPSIPSYSAPPAPTYRAPPVYQPRTWGNNYDTRRYDGPSAGTIAGAAALGAAGGVIAGNVLSNGIGGNHPSQVVVNNGSAGAAVGQAPQVAADQWGATPAYQSTAPHSGGFFSFLGSLILGIFQFLLLAVLVAGTYFGLKKAISMYQSRKASNNGVGPIAASWAGGTASTDANLAPVAKFMQIQRAYAGHDMEALRGLLGPNLIETVQFEGKPGLCTVVNAQATKVYEDSDEVSYRMTALDTEDNSKINEVWHFVKIGSQWKLDGVEQIYILEH